MTSFSTMTSLADGYRALVIGAGGGIGAAFVQRLTADPGCAGVSALSRRNGDFDLTDEDSIRAAAEGFAASGTVFDLIVCATGALVIGGQGPEKTIRALSPAAMAEQFAVNAIGPALVLKYFSPLLAKDRRSVFAALSARVGSIGDNRLGGWMSYRASKAALNQIVRTAAIEIARARPLSVVAVLHPGTVATALSDDFSNGRERLSPADSAGRMLQVLDGLQPEQTGGFYAYDGTPIVW